MRVIKKKKKVCYGGGAALKREGLSGKKKKSTLKKIRSFERTMVKAGLNLELVRKDAAGVGRGPHKRRT